jgi:hypothetical protein
MKKTSIILPEEIQGSVSYYGAFIMKERQIIIYLVTFKCPITENERNSNSQEWCYQLSSIRCKLKILE